MYRVSIFSLLALHYPPTELLTHAYTNTRSRARGSALLAVFFFLSLFFPLSTLQLAAPLARRLSFYSFRTRARACIYTLTHALVSHSRNRTIRSYNSCPVRPFLSPLFFSSIFPQPPSRETALAPSGRRAAAARRE